MTFVLENFQVAWPEIILLITACIVLLVDLFFRSRQIAFGIATTGLVLAAIISYLMLGNYKITTFGGLFVSDDLAQLSKLFIYLIIFLCFFYSREYVKERQIPSGEYYILGLFSTLGMMVLISAHSLLTVYLGLELLSLPLYALTAMQRSNTVAAEAAMKYFIMGTIASGMLLYGFSLLYGATGKLDLLDIANAITANWNQQSSLLLFSMVFIIVGVGFKLALFPFHMWAPDVYQGAPTAVTLLISTAPKIAAIGMAFRLFTLGLPSLATHWQQIFIVISLLSVSVGNLLAIVQFNLKRLFAYSAISHAGYALFGLLTANSIGYAACLYYALIYGLMTAAAFGLLVLMSCKGMEVESVDDLKGLNQRNPWVAFMMLIVMFSMAGVPPTVGFIIKLLVLKALVDAQLLWLAVVGLFFAVLGAYYYIRIIKVMYFDESRETLPLKFSLPVNLVFSGNCLALLYLGLFPSGLMTACINAFT